MLKNTFLTQSKQIVYWFALGSLLGQTPFFSKYLAPITSLTDSQIYKWNLIQAKEEYGDVNLVTFNPDAITEPNGIVMIEKIDGIDGVRFKSYHVEYQGFDNVNWMAKKILQKGLAV